MFALIYPNFDGNKVVGTVNNTMKKRLVVIVFIGALVINMVSLSGCNKDEDLSEYVTRGEWISMLAEGFGLDTYHSKSPYYSDITVGNEAFAPVQALYEWGILSIYVADKLEPDSPVTYDEAASTAAIAAGFSASDGQINGEDVFNSKASIDFALAHGIVSPIQSSSKYLTPEECEDIIAKAQKVYLEVSQEESLIAVPNKNLISLVEILPTNVRADGDEVSFSGAAAGEVTQDETGNLTAVIHTENSNIEVRIGDTFIAMQTALKPWGTAYKVTAIEETDGVIVFTTTTPDLADMYDELNVHTTVSMDDGYIVWNDGIVVSDAAPNSLSAHNTTHSPRKMSQGIDNTQTYSYPFHAEWKTKKESNEPIFVYDDSYTITDGAAAEGLQSSSFTYKDTPSIDDFNGSTQPWEEKLELKGELSGGYEIQGEIGIDLNVTLDLEYNELDLIAIEIPTGLSSASMKLDSKLYASLDMKGNLSGEIHIGEIIIPTGAPGLSVEGGLYLYADASGTLQLKVELKNEERTEWNESAGFRHLSGRHTAKPEMQAALDLSFGTGLSLSTSLFSAKIIGADVKAGGEVEANGSVVGTCVEHTEGGVTQRTYTESIKMDSSFYLPVVTLTVSGPDYISDIFGLEKTWEIIGKDKATKHPLMDETWAFWSQTVTLDENGEIIDDTIDISGIELPHTYATRFEAVNMVTYPPFRFEYPDGWTVIQEEVSDFSERVTLVNSRGATVSFWYYGESRDLTGPISGTNIVDVLKVADAQFIPGYVQATNYADLGQFMVARLNIASGSGNTGAGNVGARYALLPETMIGTQTETIIDGLPTFSFWYAGHISMIATAPDGVFSPQEAREAVAILASFKAVY